MFLGYIHTYREPGVSSNVSKEVAICSRTYPI